LLNSRRLLPAVVLTAGFLAVAGCERRPYGVDFSADQDYDFSAIRRVAIVEAHESGKAAGIERVLADAASDALGTRFLVVHGNRLKVAVQVAKVADAFQTLRTQLASGADPDADLVSTVSKAIGVDGFYATQLAALDRRVQPDYSQATVLTSSGSNYAHIQQTSHVASITTIRLNARLVDGASGLVVWSGSKFAESSLNIEHTGLKPLLRSVSEDFVMTVPLRRHGMPEKGSWYGRADV
jgi:hypothetical protein